MNIIDNLKSLFFWFISKIVDLFVYLLSLIPVPDFIQNLQTYTPPEGVVYFLNFFNFDVGIGIIVTAYIARFIIRRLPVVG